MQLVRIWLFYIQPWNGMKPAVAGSSQVKTGGNGSGNGARSPSASQVLEPDRSPVAVVGQRSAYTAVWATFVYENFLLYHTLLASFLARTGAFDFERTFTEGNLTARVLAAFSNEKLVDTLVYSEREAIAFSAKEHSFPLQRVPPEDRVVKLLRFHIQSLKSAKIEITPLFSDKRPEMVKSLNGSLLYAIAKLRPRPHQIESHKSQGLFRAVQSWLFPKEEQDKKKEEYIALLGDMSQNLRKIFSQADPGFFDSGSPSSDSDLSETQLQQPESDGTGLLTAAGKKQVRLGQRKCTNFDVRPKEPADDLILSYEVPFLVRAIVPLNQRISRMLLHRVNLRFLARRSVALVLALVVLIIVVRFLFLL